MKTVYKTIKINDDNILYINKKEIMKLDISHYVFRDGVIKSLKEQLIKYESCKKRVNHLLENDFNVTHNINNDATLTTDRMSLFIASSNNSIVAIIN